ncbi:MAG: CpaD family pilus assembly protein [Pseudomonadota bacterium]
MTLMSKSKSGAKLLIAVSLTAIALTGCRHLENPGTKVAAWNLVDASQRHPILVSEQPTEMDLHVRRGQHSLTPHQRAQVLSFVQHFRASDSGNGRIIIAAPSGSANEVAGMHAVKDLRNLIAEEGIADADMVVEAYSTGKSSSPPIKLSFLRYVAEAPQCGHFPTNLASEPGNLPYPNFGCATQRSLAAQIANPADLLEPRTMTARSSERRDVTWNRYVKGEISAAEKSDDERLRIEDE